MIDPETFHGRVELASALGPVWVFAPRLEVVNDRNVGRVALTLDLSAAANARCWHCYLSN